MSRLQLFLLMCIIGMVLHIIGLHSFKSACDTLAGAGMALIVQWWVEESEGAA